MNDLMTLADIAEMNHCSLRHARDVLVKLPGFPDEAPTSTPTRRYWSQQQVWNFTHRKPVATPGEHCLYRHFDAPGNLLYVGISLSAVKRLGEHNRSARWADQIVRVEITRLPTRRAVEAAEQAAIKAERPIYNKQHAGGAIQ